MTVFEMAYSTNHTIVTSTKLIYFEMINELNVIIAI